MAELPDVAGGVPRGRAETPANKGPGPIALPLVVVAAAGPIPDPAAQARFEQSLLGSAPEPAPEAAPVDAHTETQAQAPVAGPDALAFPADVLTPAPVPDPPPGARGAHARSDRAFASRPPAPRVPSRVEDAQRPPAGDGSVRDPSAAAVLVVASGGASPMAADATQPLVQQALPGPVAVSPGFFLAPGSPGVPPAQRPVAQAPVAQAGDASTGTAETVTASRARPGLAPFPNVKAPPPLAEALPPVPASSRVSAFSGAVPAPGVYADRAAADDGPAEVPDAPAAAHARSVAGRSRRPAPGDGPPDPYAPGLPPAGIAASPDRAQPPAPAAGAEPWIRLQQVVEEAVARLAVGTDSRGAPQLRVELRHDLLPGTRMVVQELGGRVQIDLICAGEASRQRLSVVAAREIGEIARRCKRDLLLRIQDEELPPGDGPAPAVFEVLGVA